MSISRTSEEFDAEEFRRGMRLLLDVHHDQGLTQMNVGKMLLQMASMPRQLP